MFTLRKLVLFWDMFLIQLKILAEGTRKFFSVSLFFLFWGNCSNIFLIWVHISPIKKIFPDKFWGFCRVHQAHCKCQKLTKERFLDLRNMFLNQENVRIFSQSKWIRLTKKTIPVPSARKFNLKWKTYLKTRTSSHNKKTFLTKEVFIISRKTF